MITKRLHARSCVLHAYIVLVCIMYTLYTLYTLIYTLYTLYTYYTTGSCRAEGHMEHVLLHNTHILARKLYTHHYTYHYTLYRNCTHISYTHITPQEVVALKSKLNVYYSLLHFECHSISISNLIGLFSHMCRSLFIYV